MHHFKQIHSQLVNSLPAFGQPNDISQSIKKISDLYIAKKSNLSDIWLNDSLTLGYLSYFLPLNLYRLKYVLEEAQRIGFLSGIEHLIDFGSGPGTLDLAFNETPHSFQTSTFIESGLKAIESHQKLIQKLNLPAKNKTWKSSFTEGIRPKTLLAFSYALNELSSLPNWALKADALLFLEPSTQQDGRRLQELRQTLIEQGYSIWAPCTHHERCPLLAHSKTDWCHQRIHVELSPRLLEIEKYLPIKNQSLTFSYLLAKRSPPPKSQNIRIIGDTQYERGKIKQSVCRGSKREFLTWLTRYGEPEPLERGSLFTLPDGAEEKGNEIRLPEQK